MIIALSRFGNFSNIRYLLSSSSDVYPNTHTFTFRDAVYTSPYISFVGVEEYGPGGTSDVRQPLTSDQQALVSQYNPQASIPFIDFGNSYSIVGAQVSSPDTINGNWTHIASQLNNPNSNVAKNLDVAANYLISAICKIDGGQPSNVCAQSYATLPLSFHPPAQGGHEAGSLSFLLLLREEQRRWII